MPSAFTYNIMSVINESRVHHRSYAKIDLDAINHNFDSLKALLNPGVLCMAIIKADAYSHGSVKIAKELESKADYFGVAVAEEAVLLRENGIRKPILILSYTLPYQYHLLLKYDITQTVSTFEEAKLISDIAVSFGKTAKIHIGLDTGMSRIGFPADKRSVETIKRISKLPNIFIEGLFSHYACADEADKADANRQTELFKSFIAELDAQGIEIPIKHICNSAGITEMDEHFDMVRMGIALYGMYPSDEVDKSQVELHPAMEVISHVIHIHTVPAGTGIGYGHTFITQRETKIATIGIGYADGYPRGMSNRGKVLINGCFAPILGRVCMDLCMVDITDIPNVKVEDTVVILGSDGDKNITAEEIGEISGSFNYEIVCGFKKRVARVYYKNGVPEDE